MGKKRGVYMFFFLLTVVLTVFFSFFFTRKILIHEAIDLVVKKREKSSFLKVYQFQKGYCFLIAIVKVAQSNFVFHSSVLGSPLKLKKCGLFFP